MDQEIRGTLLALMTATVSGFAIVANKFFITGLDPAVFTAVRALLIGLVFLVISVKHQTNNYKFNNKDSNYKIEDWLPKSFKYAFFNRLG